jgi:CRISPR-associated protein Cmr2
MANYVLLISVGPVQEFIASARKCRDLWYGSWLLSELSHEVAVAVDCEASERNSDTEALVFPTSAAVRSVSNQSKGTEKDNVANKILARLVNVTEQQVNEIADSAQQCLKKKLKELADNAFARVGKGDERRSEIFEESTAYKQVAELIEYCWVAIQEEETKHPYQQARQRAERMLTARKNSKLWSQPSWSAEVPKSSLDGVRESVLKEELYDQPLSGRSKKRPGFSEKRLERYGVHGAERLCGVGLLKRHGRDIEGDKNQFLSTSHMAALPFMLGIESYPNHGELLLLWRDMVLPSLGSKAKQIRREFTVGNEYLTEFFGLLDGGILFQNRLLDVMDQVESDEKEKKAASGRMNSFLGKAGVGELIPYYAILLADGDNMGSVIDHCSQVEEHRKISENMAQFAKHARTIVENNHQGSLVYSGGDDVLALLPLHTALHCAQELHEDFGKRMKAWPNGDGKVSTLSVGIAIVHHLQPLDDAINLARKAEKNAKSVPGKDALAILVQKRGGSPVAIQQSWKAEGNGPIMRLERLKSLINTQVIPEKLGPELSELGRLLYRLKTEDKANMDLVVEAGIRRMLYRKKGDQGKTKLAKKIIEELDSLVNQAPVEFANEYYIASLFAKVERQFQGTKKSSTKDTV